MKPSELILEYIDDNPEKVLQFANLLRRMMQDWSGRYPHINGIIPVVESFFNDLTAMLHGDPPFPPEVKVGKDIHLDLFR